MPLQIGQSLLGRYRIEALIGEGTFGFVYRAIDQTSQQPVAIKELRPELGIQSEAFQRFMREASAAQAIQHPNIVAGYGLEMTPEGCYIISEYMDGGSLADLLRERGALAPEDAANIAQMMLDALDVIHARGIIHRDIKPSNILFSQDGCVKLCDFGIARIPIVGEQSLTMIGTVIGTINYMSPEQARGERVDARSDVYSVGAVLHEMLSGSPYLAFGRNALKNLELLKKLAPAPLPPTVPQPLAAIVSRALAKPREGRFQSASDMRHALLRFLRQGSRTRPSAPTGGLSARIIIGLLAVGAVLAVCFMAAAVLALYLITR